VTVVNPNIAVLLRYQAKLNIQDTDGRDPLMYAVMENNEPLIRLLMDNKMHGPIGTDCQDKLGKSAAHYVVNPIRFGSYENVRILEELHRQGFDLGLED
jgi:ankyrin repeat protein